MVASLSPKDTAKRLSTPPLQGRGRGWGLSAEKLAELKRRARNMRNNPTEPEKLLWRHLSNAQLGDHKFRRQAVIGPIIADFLCPKANLIVEVDGDTHDKGKDAKRDAALAQQGYRTLRFTNRNVMQNMDGVLQAILEALHQVDSPHPNPSPKGEGLKTANMQMANVK